MVFLRKLNVQPVYSKNIFAIKVQVFTASVFSTLKFQVKSIILIVNLNYISAVRSHQSTLKADIACFLLVFMCYLVSVLSFIMMK